MLCHVARQISCFPYDTIAPPRSVVFWFAEQARRYPAIAAAVRRIVRPRVTNGRLDCRSSGKAKQGAQRPGVA